MERNTGVLHWEKYRNFTYGNLYALHDFKGTPVAVSIPKKIILKYRQLARNYELIVINYIKLLLLYIYVNGSQCF